MNLHNHTTKLPLEPLLPIKKGMYKHYKGSAYEVLGIARHSETLEEFVLYTHDGNFWVRPYAMFFDEVIIEGKKIPRFEPLNIK